MHLYIRIKKHTAKEVLLYLFIVFCFIPFLFPNPIVRTNIQPYAALLGTLILLLHSVSLFKSIYGRNTALILGCTFLIALAVMLFGGISINAVRGVYNYYALFVIPCAAIIALEELHDFPEDLCKTIRIHLL